MATKSLLLSCLLMGLGAAQHPASEATQTPNVPFSVAASSSPATASSGAASYATSTATSTDPGHEATNLPPRFPEIEQCDPWLIMQILSANADGAAGTFCYCSANVNPYWLKPGMAEECTEAAMYLPAGYAMWCAENGPYPDIAQFICTSFEDQLRACNSHLQVPECQHLSQVVKRFGSPYWDVSKPNRKSSSSISPVEQSESLHRLHDVPSVGSKSAHQDTLEQRDAEEPYHPVLKPIYEDCEALAHQWLRDQCVIKQEIRALCEQDPQIIGCEDVWSDGDDLLPINLAASDNNENGSRSHGRVTAAPQQATNGSLVDWNDPSPYIMDSFRKCQNAGKDQKLVQCLEKVADRLLDECLLAPDYDDWTRCAKKVDEEKLLYNCFQAPDYDTWVECEEKADERRLLQDCFQAPDYDTWVECEETVDEICSRNPADKLCQVFLVRS